MKKTIPYFASYFLFLFLIENIIMAQPCDNNVFKPSPRYFKTAYYPYTKRTVYENNKTRFIIAEKGDTFEKIAQEINVEEYELRDFNDIYDSKVEPCEGEAIYLQNKQKKSNVKYHIVREGESLRGISQRHAIRLKILYKNNFKAGIVLTMVKPGDKICISCK